MDWSQAVDIYCERTSAAFWAEPLNAISNASFLAGALWGAVTARQRQITSPVVWLLIGMAGLIGIGSFLFHTFANVWSGLADVIPIWSFVALFVFVAMHRIGGVQPRRVVFIALGIAAVLIIVFLAMDNGAAPAPSGPISSAPDPLNGSGQYAPAVLALLAFAIVAWRRRHPMAIWITAAAAVFLLSLAFRTIDMRVCASFPAGTHFMWHALNGLMIGLLLQVLTRSPAVWPSSTRM